MLKLAEAVLDLSLTAVDQHGYGDFFPEPPELALAKQHWNELRPLLADIKQGRGLSPVPTGGETTLIYSLNHARSGSDSSTASNSPLLGRPRRSEPCPILFDSE
jgi:hypothetical protein